MEGKKQKEGKAVQKQLQGAIPSKIYSSAGANMGGFQGENNPPESLLQLF